MPSDFADLITRQAISPRFAIKIFSNNFHAFAYLDIESERNIVMLFPRILGFLVS